MKHFSPEVFLDLDLDDIFDRIVVHTPYGDTEKKAMRPYGPENVEALIHELDRVEQITAMIQDNRYGFVDMRGTFSRVKDLRGTFNRLSTGEVLAVTELFEIKTLSLAMKKLAETAEKLKGKLPEEARVHPLPEVDLLLDPAGNGTPTFYIYDDYAPELLEIRTRLRTLEDEIQLERKRIRLSLEDKLGVRLRPGGDLAVAKDDHALIERLKTERDLVYSSETYVNITFRLRGNEAIDRMCALVEELRSEEETEEFAVRKVLSDALRELLPFLEENARAIGRLDLLTAKGYFAIGFDCVRPDIVRVTYGDSGTSISRSRGLSGSEAGEADEEAEILEIVDGRHLKVEQQLKKSGGQYTPVSLKLTRGVTCITGANMGGKTVTLKMVGMLTAVAQYGLFVPAKAMRLSPRAFIYTSIGDLQDVDQGLSTFGAEIVKVAEAIRLSGLPGLILIDELARGTNPKEGFAISMAIVHYLRNAGAMTLITTHFDGLADAPDVHHLQVMGLSFVDFKEVLLEMENHPEKGIELLKKSMDYRLKEIHSPEEVPKDAIQIAALMGLNEGILEDAKRQLLAPRTFDTETVSKSIKE
jgi:dsDNA-specific endonuclease/ATPase MutS2